MLNPSDIKVIVELLSKIEITDKESKVLYEKLVLICEQIDIQEEMNKKLYDIQDKMNKLLKED